MESQFSDIDSILLKSAKSQAEMDKVLLETSECFKQTFTTPQGEKCLAILSNLFYNRPCFEGNDPNPYLAAKRDGNREVMMQIYNFMGTANERTN